MGTHSRDYSYLNKVHHDIAAILVIMNTQARSRCDFGHRFPTEMPLPKVPDCLEQRHVISDLGAHMSRLERFFD